ncbi:uncharacterized protein K452DRAFT_207083 [Neofusicoccum parvum]|nr:uncharacterized protein K452DRAFT_207083 [Neofusicoccum parvum]
MASSSDGVGVPGFYAYDYDELPDQSHIRLFELFPGKPEDPVQGRLLTGSIAQVPLYESISYVWGDQTDICAIICAGRALRITRSLHGALRTVRPAHGSRPRLLWADALCINQANPQERGNQVQLMRSIYALAARVLVWLGRDDTGKAHEAIGALEHIAGTWGTSHIVRLCQVLDPAVFHAIRGLLERPWFDRIWVLQEIGVASSAVFFCGEAVISWTDLYIACQNLRQCGAEAGSQR